MEHTLLTLDRYLEVLQQDTEDLAVVLEGTDLATPVHSCPGWTLADLGFHVGEVHRFWRWIVRDGVQEVTRTNSPSFARPPDRELADWLRTGLADFLPELMALNPAAPAWSWTPQRDMAFIQRRMPHETSVHRWDAQGSAACTPAPIAADLAADGVSEFFLLASAARYSSEVSVSLRATDTGHRWWATIQGGEIRYGAGEAAREGGLLVSGTASDLLLILWRRLSLDGSVDTRVTVSGDRSAAVEFLRLVDLD